MNPIDRIAIAHCQLSIVNYPLFALRFRLIRRLAVFAICLESPRILQCPAEQEFDLAVDAAQLIFRPPAQRVEQFGIGSQQKGIAFHHGDVSFLVLGSLAEHQ